MSSKRILPTLLLLGYIGAKAIAGDINIDYSHKSIDASFNTHDDIHIYKDSNGKYHYENNKKIKANLGFKIKDLTSLFTDSPKEKVQKEYFSNCTNDEKDISEYKIPIELPRRKTKYRSIFYPKQYEKLLHKLAIAYNNQGNIYFKGNLLVNKNGGKPSYYSLSKNQIDNFYEHIFTTHCTNKERHDSVITQNAIIRMINQYSFNKK